MTDSHRNDERTVRCPVEGCDATPLARGINLHIRQSSGGGHGPRGKMPDHISLDNLETVGEREVEMNYPEERDTEDVARLCPYCALPYKGTNGVLIHLGQVAGTKNHPKDAAEKHTEGDFPRVEVDKFENVTEVIDDADRPERSGTDNAGVPRQRVYRLIASLVADDEMRTAHRVRRALLETDDAVAPSRDEPPHPELFEALLTQGRADRTDHRVTAALEGEGIMVACRGESVLYTAPEAREVATRLEQVAVSEGWDEGRAAGFIEFLRHGADVLDGDRTERSLHEELDNWL